MIVQRDATQSSLFIILQVHSTCFRCQPHPSSGVHKTVTTFRYWPYFCTASSLQRCQASLATLEGGSCRVPEAVVTVLFTPDDRCGCHPKHVDWTCRIISKLLCVASGWAIINIQSGPKVGIRYILYSKIITLYLLLARLIYTVVVKSEIRL